MLLKYTAEQGFTVFASKEWSFIFVNMLMFEKNNESLIFYTIFSLIISPVSHLFKEKRGDIVICCTRPALLSTSVLTKVVLVPCVHNSYSFMRILFKIYRYFGHGLKMCMWFGYNPQIFFCHFVHK